MKHETVQEPRISRGRVYISFYSNRNGTRIMRYPRYLMEQHLGRKLLKSEVVHHIDRNPLNNNLENLELMDRTAHYLLKHIVDTRPCKYCHKTYEAISSQKFCSHACKTKFHSLARSQ